MPQRPNEPSDQPGRGRSTGGGRAGSRADRRPECERAETRTGRRQAGGPDTRARIQEVALELFAEQGYDSTSLREIADRLGVTKAALYYHFRSKEEIVVATVEEFLADIDALVAWAEERPRTTDTRHEVLRRYADIVRVRFPSMRFFQQNPAGMHRSGLGERFQQRMGALHGVLYDGGPPQNRIRALLAIVGMHMAAALSEDSGMPIGAGLGLSSEEANRAALDVAFSLVDAEDTAGAEGTASAQGTASAESTAKAEDGDESEPA
ncbi:regulatory protein, tetR family [Actinopolymorpha cephalotaxi]|uniref:AcrR family transcriptional regulator n=1 Tax=Actinopolymorpha cephalotaxi TaxID=504797 RepID=A0A1I2XU02_9ACTN|nr:TetR/AcrR family transcriptional regulator [Actinopolymorpha cephalotaxi]NYH87169.1 AcrR family transcriptional regulator [Actinopolymorpha cephalotaxi]SFH16539.1 regulatory protein, tetR family [Actinopolymorpha cephalotaxi]